MKIAVTYKDGNVFQHFGHTEEFKVYNVENGVIASSEVVSTAGQGHGMLAGFLKAQGVEVLICGGIGGGIIGRALNKKINSSAVDKLFIGLMSVIVLICIYNAIKNFI